MFSQSMAAFSVGRDTFLRFDGENFCVFRTSSAPNWTVPNLHVGENTLPNGAILRIENVKIGRREWENLKNVDVCSLCYAAISKNSKISAKNYAPSHEYVRFGHGSAKKLGDIFPSKNLPRERRKFLPVVFVDGVACWMPGLPVSDFFKIRQMDSAALLLTFIDIFSSDIS
jgi:hypothetical protein